MGTLSPRPLCMHAFPIYFRDAHDEGSCWMSQNDSMMGKLRTWNMTSLGLVSIYGGFPKWAIPLFGASHSEASIIWGLY